MPLPESVQQKLFHARMHFEVCKTEMQEYFDSVPAKMVRDADSSSDHPTFSLQIAKPIPARLVLLVGDSLQNLRSTLDYLVWELVLAAKNVPSKKNMFPVCNSSDIFKDALRSKRLLGVAPEALAIVESLQPYQSGEMDAAGIPLSVLDSLTNINKHQRLPLTIIRTFPASELITLRIGNEEWGQLSPTAVQSDSNFGQRVTSAEVQAKGGMAAYIGFNEGAAKGLEIATVVNVLIEFVASDVLPHFDKFF
jgi:hypothetical protein